MPTVDENDSAVATVIVPEEPKEAASPKQHEKEELEDDDEACVNLTSKTTGLETINFRVSTGPVRTTVLLFSSLTRGRA